MCNGCIHEKLCKYKEEYEEEIKKVDVSKLTANFIIIKSFCKNWKDGGGMFVQENVLYRGKVKKIIY